MQRESRSNPHPFYRKRSEAYEVPKTTTARTASAKRPKDPEAGQTRKNIRFASQARPEAQEAGGQYGGAQNYRSGAKKGETPGAFTFKSILKRSQPAAKAPPASRRKPKTAAAVSAEDKNALKVFSVTCRSVKYYAKKFCQKNCQVGPHLYELIGALDSSVMVDTDSKSKSFMLKDKDERLNCVFYEIDREMEKVRRDSWVRCVGIYDPIESIFKCLSIRLATQDELFQFASHVSQTDTEIHEKYL